MRALGFGARMAPGAFAARPGFAFERAPLADGATLTRASGAVAIGAGGTLVASGANVARFDHDPLTLASRGLLIESAATNLMVWSRDLAAAGWSRSGATTTTGTVIENGAASASHFAYQLVDYVAGQAYSFAVSAREIAGSAKRYLTLALNAPAFASQSYAKFDLAAGAVTYASANVIASVARTVDGRWRCAVAATAVATGSSQTQVRLAASSQAALTYSGDGASGVDVTDVQVEAGAASSPVVTAGAAATRAADVLTLNWGALGVRDGAAVLRCLFDDGSGADVAVVVAPVVAPLPLPLARARVRRVWLA